MSPPRVPPVVSCCAHLTQHCHLVPSFRVCTHLSGPSLGSSQPSDPNPERTKRGNSDESGNLRRKTRRDGALLPPQLCPLLPRDPFSNILSGFCKDHSGATSPAWMGRIVLGFSLAIWDLGARSTMSWHTGDTAVTCTRSPSMVWRCRPVSQAVAHRESHNNSVQSFGAAWHTRI